jgi:16S rRNA (cytosine967-C5)-methyltransferase
VARNPEIKWELSPDDLTDLQSRQLEILQVAMGHVEIGGRLTYSTCSLEREENEQVVERALVSNSSFELVDCRAALQDLRSRGDLVCGDFASITSGPFLRTIPGIQECDGFFAAILQKK